METIEIMISVGTLVLWTGGIIIGFYKFILSREKDARQEMTKMHEQQDKRIEKAEDAAKDIKDNYNRKFQKVHDAMHDTEMKITSALSALELNLRSSHHTLADSVTKSLVRLEMIITKNQS